MDDEFLQVTWTDPRGQVWPLTGPEAQVRLAVDQAGFGLPNATHTHTPSGMISATVVEPAQMDLVVHLADPYTSGQAFYRLHSEWWGEANSYFTDGRLAVRRPDGVERHRMARLRATPGTTYHHDPGLPLERAPELWPLVAQDAWWRGEEQVVTITEPRAGGGRPNFFPSNTGAAAGDIVLRPTYDVTQNYVAPGFTNQGDLAMWPHIELQGPLDNPKITFEGPGGGGSLTYNYTISAGRTIVIITDPNRRAVYDKDSGVSRYDRVSGTWSAVAPHTSVTVEAEVNGEPQAGSRITVRASSAFATAF